MATLVENANAVASCATAIDAAITAKGGSLVGGGKLRNAAAGIATIPTSPTEEHWWDELDATIFEISINHDLTITDEAAFSSGSKIWWDAENDGASGYVTKSSSDAVSHTYSATGNYIFIVQDGSGNWQSKFGDNIKARFISRVTRIIRFQTNIWNLYYWAASSAIKGKKMECRDFTHISSSYCVFGGNAFIGVNPEFYFSTSNQLACGECVGSGVLKVHGLVGASNFKGFDRCEFYDSTNAPSMQGSDYCMTSFYAPKATWFWGNTFYGCQILKNIEVGTVGSMGSLVFNNTGIALAVDAEGFKTIVKVGNTCESLLAVSGFPGGAPSYTKFVCSDGYVSYDSSTSSWVAHTEE